MSESKEGGMSTLQEEIQRMPGNAQPSKQPRVWTANEWCEYYRANAGRLLVLPWEGGAGLSDEEKEAVATSLQEFQIGEQSEGRNLLNRARQYADLTGD